jgi:hypothetical protein
MAPGAACGGQLILCEMTKHEMRIWCGGDLSIGLKHNVMTLFFAGPSSAYLARVAGHRGISLYSNFEIKCLMDHVVYGLLANSKKV